MGLFCNNESNDRFTIYPSALEPLRGPRGRNPIYSGAEAADVDHVRPHVTVL